MTNTISKQDKLSTQKVSQWDKAIADARRTIHRLELAIETYQQNKKEGVPWPGDRKSPQD